MCEPASFVITKDKICWSKNSEFHEDIIAENNLKDVANVQGEPVLVRVEISPPDMDFRLPIEKWVFRIDQQELPKWFVKKDAEKLVRKKCKEWLAAKVVLPEQKIKEISGGQIIAIYGTVNDIRGGTVNDIRGGTVNGISGGKVNYIRGGKVNGISGGTVNYIRGGKVNYISGGTVNGISGGTVNYISGVLPKRITGNATIITYSALTPDILNSSKAVLIDRSKDTVVCYVGKD